MIDDTYVVTGKNYSADLVELSHDGFKPKYNLNTGGNEVNAVCLLHGNQPGISMVDIRDEEEKDSNVVILGCSNGWIYRYEDVGY